MPSLDPIHDHPSRPDAARTPARPAGPSYTPGAVGAVLDSAEARELAAALRAADPMRADFDVAVRRFVRAERGQGRDLDTILAALSSVLRSDVEPTLAASRSAALRDAVAWFAVSEFYRAD